MKVALQNFYKCITNHPQYNSDCTLFIGYSARYFNLANDICKDFPIFNPQLHLKCMELDVNNLEQIKNSLTSSNLFILFYDSDYKQPLGRSVIVQQIISELKQFWQKSCVLKDYGSYFNEAFGVCPSELQNLNNQLMSIANESNFLRYSDDLGSNLEVDVANARWTSVCGCGNLDLVPGEIATFGKVNGIVKFTGSFLSIIPLAPKYGLIKEPLTLTIKDNIIVDVAGDDIRLITDFKKYIQYNTSNATVEEVGIGTNYAVKLRGINAGFEERHVGLHLGLGGGKSGSDHLDLIFQSGSLFFNETLIIKNETICFDNLTIQNAIN